MSFYSEIINEIKLRKLNKKQINRWKTKLCKKHGLKNIPTDIEILLNASVDDLKIIKKTLLSKPTRTISGVAVVAIMTKPMPCPHGKCTICPGGVDSHFGNVPQSYTGKEPATRRALRNNFDAYLQVMNRLEQYIVQGHVPEKVELIIMGGTFPSFPKKYQEEFVRDSFKAMNDFSDMFYKVGNFDFVKFKEFFELPRKVGIKKIENKIQKKLLKIKNKNKKSLEVEQKINERSNIRCVALCIETRPDYGMLKHGNEMLRLGATRVELGIQTVYDSVLEKIERGHSVRDTIRSTRILKDLGFKINYHVMPGLPNVSKEEDLKALKQLFDYPEFRPDMLKIYPCMVLKGTKLFSEWKKGKFKPMDTKNAASLIAEFKQYVPEYLRIQRVQRDIPTFTTEAGVDRTNLRQYVEKLMKEKGLKCRCIRCREIKNKKIKNYEIKIIKYNASKGTEYFIAAESGDSLLGFCRLRFPYKSLRKEITKDSALIRELHVYGTSTAIGSEGDVQHKGIGKKLLKEAEKISLKNGKKKIVVISGVGAKEYYKKLGYKKEGAYVVKN